MNYNLRKSNVNDLEYLENVKLKTIFEYAKNITSDEEEKINNYVKNNIKNNVDNYQIIMSDNEIIGCVLLTKIDDGMLLDEIYLEEKYRNLGIGTNIIKDYQKEYPTIYLWVYQDNIKAIELYKKLGFNVVDKTDTRFYMKWV